MSVIESALNGRERRNSNDDHKAEEEALRKPIPKDVLFEEVDLKGRYEELKAKNSVLQQQVKWLEQERQRLTAQRPPNPINAFDFGSKLTQHVNMAHRPKHRHSEHTIFEQIRGEQSKSGNGY